MRHLVKRAAVFLIMGAFVTVMVCVVLAATDDLTAGSVVSAEGWAGDQLWSVTRWDRPAGTRVVSRDTAGRNWSPGQALGPPDTPTGGDQVTAWASSSSDGAREWLILDFAQAVVPKSARVYEMCSTGALDKVEVANADGTFVQAWAGVDPLPRGQSMGTSEVPLTGVDYPISRLKIHLDSPNVSGWNEIDAVALVGQDGSVQYAVDVQASSVYASGASASGSASFAGPQALAPRWAGFTAPVLRELKTPLPQPPNHRERSFVRRPDVVAEARGWPMLALAGRRVVDATAAPGSPPGSGQAFTAFTLAPPTPARAEQPVMLYRPIPLGFAVNTILAAGVLWVLYWALTVPRRFLLEAGRMRRGCCVACGYDVGYDFVAGCPECGWNREAKTGRPMMRRREAPAGAPNTTDA